MKYFFLFGCLFASAVQARAQSTQRQNIAASKVLARLSATLNRLQKIHYEQERELNYSSENYHHKGKWNVFLDYQSTDSIVGFRYQVDDEAAKHIFNGTEKFDLDKKKKTINVNDHPTAESLGTLSAFYNSIVTLKNVLPLLLSDENINKQSIDTSIDGRNCQQVTIFLNKRRIQNLGKGLDAMTTKSNFIYTITLDKTSGLPLSILQQNDGNTDFIKTNFNQFDTVTVAPAELTWFYSSYIDSYKKQDPVSATPIIAIGSAAPQWSLPSFGANESIKLDDLKGKVVILEFWIKNCGPCILSVPVLNAVQAKYAGRKLEIIGVNAYDEEKDIRVFCNNNKPAYKIVRQGKGVAEQYGIPAFPSVVILDKAGKVAYAGLGLDQAGIEQIVNRLL